MNKKKTCFKYFSFFSKLTGNVELHLGGIFAMDVAHDDLVSTLVVGLRLPHAEGDRVGLRIREELKTATVDDLGDAFVKLESWRGCALHRDGEIRRRVCKMPLNLVTYSTVILSKYLINLKTFLLYLKTL